jgi:hypothetical protein
MACPVCGEANKNFAARSTSDSDTASTTPEGKKHSIVRDAAGAVFDVGSGAVEVIDIFSGF